MGFIQWTPKPGSGGPTLDELAIQKPKDDQKKPTQQNRERAPVQLTDPQPSSRRNKRIKPSTNAVPESTTTRRKASGTEPSGGKEVPAVLEVDQKLNMSLSQIQAARAQLKEQQAGSQAGQGRRRATGKGIAKAPGAQKSGQNPSRRPAQNNTPKQGKSTELRAPGTKVASARKRGKPRQVRPGEASNKGSCLPARVTDRTPSADLDGPHVSLDGYLLDWAEDDGEEGNELHHSGSRSEGEASSGLEGGHLAAEPEAVGYSSHTSLARMHQQTLAGATAGNGNVPGQGQPCLQHTSRGTSRDNTATLSIHISTRHDTSPPAHRGSTHPVRTRHRHSPDGECKARNRSPAVRNQQRPRSRSPVLHGRRDDRSGSQSQPHNRRRASRSPVRPRPRSPARHRQSSPRRRDSTSPRQHTGGSSHPAHRRRSPAPARRASEARRSRSPPRRHSRTPPRHRSRSPQHMRSTSPAHANTRGADISKTHGHSSRGSSGGQQPGIADSGKHRSDPGPSTRIPAPPPPLPSHLREHAMQHGLSAAGWQSVLTQQRNLDAAKSHSAAAAAPHVASSHTSVSRDGSRYLRERLPNPPLVSSVPGGAAGVPQDGRPRLMARMPNGHLVELAPEQLAAHGLTLESLEQAASVALGLRQG